MADVSGFASKQYINASIVKEREIKKVKVKSYDGTEVDRFNAEKSKLLLTVVANKEDYNFSLGQVNTDIMIDKFGPETDEWIGKDIELKIVETGVGDSVRVVKE